MKIRFETTVQLEEKKKERLVCLDISENIKSITFAWSQLYNRSIEEKVKNSIYGRFKSPHCICRETECGCWSAKVTMATVNLNAETAIAHIEMTQR